jgi:hypothetical protein
MLDAGTGSLRYPLPVQREQGKQRVLGRRAEPGGNEQGTELVAVLVILQLRCVTTAKWSDRWPGQLRWLTAAQS